MRLPAQQTQEFDWNVAVYSANEADRLQACLRSVVNALGRRRAVITVIVNGARDGSLEIASKFARDEARVQVFAISFPDKSNAINQFIYRLRVPARAYAGVDGYAVIGSESFIAMESRLRADPHALAVTGVAVAGSMAAYSQEALRSGGRLHGQLHAIRREFLDRMVARAIKLPLGLYRGDGLLGSMLAHNLEPRTEPWDNARIPAIPLATFETRPVNFFNVKEIRRQFRRRVRQMRGVVENEAIKEVIYRRGYESLPDDADDLIQQYLAVHGAPAVSLIDRPLLNFAIRDSARARAPSAESILPQRIA